MTTVTRNGPSIAAALGGVLALLFSGGAATWAPVENDRTIGDAVFQITGKRFRDLPYSKHDLTWS